MSGLSGDIRLRLSLNFQKKMLPTVVLIAVLWVCLPLGAQVNTGRISGAVTDQSGGAIAGAKVTVTEVGTGVARGLITDGAGQYAAPNLNPGVYTVHAEFMGFEALDRQNVNVGVGGDVRLDLTLQPGQQTQTITVTEALPIVNTTNAQTGGTLSNQLLTSLPLSGRNYRWQEDLVTGVNYTPGHGTSALNVNGINDGHGGQSLLDGVYTQTYYTQEPTFGGADEAGDTTILPLDAIQEVNVITNPKAEYGWVPGVTASIGLKSGSNNMHGDAYAFGRDTVLDAKNAFAASRQPLAFEQFGGTLGGPIKKDKLFYFMGYEGFREDLTSVVTEIAPTLADTGSTGLSIPDAIAAINAYVPPAGAPAVTLNQLSVNIAGCNFANANIHSAVAATVATACTSGNQFGAPGLWNNPNLGILPNDGHSDNGLVKVDYHLNDRHTLNASFARGEYTELAAANSAAKIAQDWWEEIAGDIGQTARAVWIWTPNSAWLNEVRWGLDMNRKPISRAECSANGDPFTDALGVASTVGNDGGPNYVTQYGLLSGAPGCGFPTIILAAPVAAQLSFSNARANQEKDDQGTEVLSYTRGTHQFKFGVDIRAVNVIGTKTVDQQSGVINFGQSGAAAFSGATSLEDFLVGVPSQETIRGGNAVRNVSTNFLDMYAQDDWRIKPRLTLNLGLREEIITSPTSPTDNLGNFNPIISASNTTGVIAGTSPFHNLYRFLPRLGFAWDLTGKGTNTIRASGGLSGGVPTLQHIMTGGSSFDLSAAPLGETLYYANGTTIVAPGTGGSSIDSLLPVSGTAGPTKGIVTSSPIIWPTNAQNSATTALFPIPIPEACGNGLPQVAPGNPAIINPSPCTTTGTSPNISYYHYFFWNVNFQHAFTHNLSLDVGYVASKSFDLNYVLNLNQAPPNDVAGENTASYEQSVAPYEKAFPWYSSIYYLDNGGTDNYRSLQVNLIERPSHGLGFTLAYTMAGNYLTQGILNINTPVAGSGPFGDNNYPLNRIAATFSYDIPGIKSPGQILEGWAVNGSVSVESGLPECVTDSKDDLSGAGAASGPTVMFGGCGGTPWSLYGSATPFNKLFGRVGTIPCYGVSGVTTSSLKSSPCIQVTAGAAATPWTNLPAACIAGASQEAPFASGLAANASGSPLEQLALIGCYTANGSAMVPPSQGTYGTMLPYALHGAGVGLTNISITKDWKFKERYSAQFRFEVFNLFNRTQYYGDGLNLGAPNALGLSTGTPDVISGGGVFSNGGPRDMQLGLKLLF